MKLVETPDPKGDGGWWARSPLAHGVPDPPRRRAGTYGTLSAPTVELGNSTTVSPPVGGREKASVRAGGRRRRNSQRPGGNGRDRVKVRQGKPNKMLVNRGSEESRGRQLSCWCALRSLRLLCPTRVVRPNWKAECVERRPLRLERGKGCEALPIATLHPHTHAPAGRTQSVAVDAATRRH